MVVYQCSRSYTNMYLEERRLKGKEKLQKTRRTKRCKGRENLKNLNTHNEKYKNCTRLTKFCLKPSSFSKTHLGFKPR